MYAMLSRVTSRKGNSQKRDFLCGGGGGSGGGVDFTWGGSMHPCTFDKVSLACRVLLASPRENSSKARGKLHGIYVHDSFLFSAGLQDFDKPRQWKGKPEGQRLW